MKKNLWVIAGIFMLMFGCPWAAVTFAPGDAGMAICFVLFFGINVLESFFVGIFSGMEVKSRWYLPVLNAAAFLLGVWTVFDWGNPDFNGYAVTYLALSALTMLITAVAARKLLIHN